MRGAIHLTILVLALSFSGISQETEVSGVPFITKYNSEDYEYHGQTWAVTHSGPIPGQTAALSLLSQQKEHLKQY